MNSLFALIGRPCILAAGARGGISSLFFTANNWTFVAPLGGEGLRWRVTLRQMVVVGVDAIPVVSVISFFIGLIIALQGAYSLRKFGASPSGECKVREAVTTSGPQLERTLG